MRRETKTKTETLMLPPNSQLQQTSALGAAFGGAECPRSLLSCKSRWADEKAEG